MIKRFVHVLTGLLLFAFIVQHGWAVNLPSWVGSTATHNWKARLGGVYWLDSRAVVKQAAPSLTQSSRPVLVDIKSDAVGYGYRFDLNTWDSRSPIYTYYSWDGTDANTAASPEDVMNILGATGNAEFILNILDRVNRELGADFDRSRFAYDAFYNGEAGRIEIYLRSTMAQIVTVARRPIAFTAGERVHVEYSYKYTVEEFGELAARAGYRAVDCWTDDARLFSVHYLQVS